MEENWKTIENLILLYRNTVNSELEVHIGRHGPKKFYSEVSEYWFTFQLKRMLSFKRWLEQSQEWEKIEEIIFAHDVRMRRNPGGIGTFMKKTLIQGVDLLLGDAKYDIRLVLKSENQTRFTHGEAKYYRFKKRKQFKNHDFTFFFSQIWEGRTLQEVSKAKTKFEIEIECNKIDCDISFMTKSLLLKCQMMVGNNDHGENTRQKRRMEVCEKQKEVDLKKIKLSDCPKIQTKASPFQCHKPDDVLQLETPKPQNLIRFSQKIERNLLAQYLIHNHGCTRIVKGIAVREFSLKLEKQTRILSIYSFQLEKE